ncbi:MAG TPA: type III-B CRISPR-associated protein Cas10/Cmr2 [Thermoanaerobaculaceae bacterium]|nr:type III-B CRISPR-associated protein Cas10/Cmr2 [Thermoanaerobaculaceae bacterium]HRS15465.1 type III-B CRISPR-associated protein Cas10/Cmr2 [Thermoanaerobaculaceae bacterium]
MSEPDLKLWQAKLAAWLHDPPEKALILARAREGHEGGTAARLRQYCLGSEELSRDLARIAKLADRWAAASDRPQWPLPKEDKGFDRHVLFWSRTGAELVHPLGGDHYNLGDVYVTTSGRIVKGASERMEGLLAGATSDLSLVAAREVPEGVLREVALDERVLDAACLPAEVGKELAATVQALRRAVLALWRLGPVSPPEELGLGPVWRLLPADSRVPDHSIWEHNALASAFAGALAADPDENPALLVVSIGPVQGFIEQSRTTSDLWAGSHLLSCLTWEAMKPVAAKLGPDAVVFPSLLGVPLVDVWLEEQGVRLPNDRKNPATPDWMHWRTDSNPLFSPCLPNRFVAVVPASQARALASAVVEGVRSWVRRQADETVCELYRIAEAGPLTEDVKGQLADQLRDFPEVYWAAVPFRELLSSPAHERAKDTPEQPTWVGSPLDPFGLAEALRMFFGPVDNPGFLGSEFWQALSKVSQGRQAAGMEAGAVTLRYEPNPGTLYPALLELAERVHAACKAARQFAQVREEGYRCTVCGEREWLRGPGDDQPTEEESRKARPRRKFELPTNKRGKTLWTKVAERDHVLAKSGEHLCALCATKRLWTRRFADMAGRWIEQAKHTETAGEPVDERRTRSTQVARFTVSTHTMALAPDLATLPLRPWPAENSAAFARRQHAFEKLAEHAERALADDAWSVLPKKLSDRIENEDGKVKAVCRALPELFDRVKEGAAANSAKDGAEEHEGPSETELARLWRQAFGSSPERYYGMILMDGDQAGKWLSGDPALMLRLEELWHSELAGWLARHHTRDDDPVRRVLACPRPPSPAFHAALSGAMSSFALETARWVVERLFLGRLIYSGGDDALAMVAVDDLLPCMFALRCAFSGIVPAGEKDSVWELYRQLGAFLGDIGSGYVGIDHSKRPEDGRNRRILKIFRAMGGRATASMGAVVAHHQAPLQAVLRRLRLAEKAAKDNGRNSFSIVLAKRGGGEASYTASWGFGGVKLDHLDPDDHRDVPYIADRWTLLTQNLVTPMGVLLRLRDNLGLPFVSRRAVYHALEWLEDLPSWPEGSGKDQLAAYREMLAKTLAWQLRRQGMDAKDYREEGYGHLLAPDEDPAASLAGDMVAVALRQCQPRPNGARAWSSVPEHLADLLTVAEFLAREGRAPTPPVASRRERGGEA